MANKFTPYYGANLTRMELLWPLFLKSHRTFIYRVILKRFSGPVTLFILDNICREVEITQVAYSMSNMASHAVVKLIPPGQKSPAVQYENGVHSTMLLSVHIYYGICSVRFLSVHICNSNNTSLTGKNCMLTSYVISRALILLN